MDPHFMQAVASGNLDLFMQLLGQNNRLLLGATPANNTVLHFAVKYGHEHLLEEIYHRHPSLLTLENLKGDTPLHLAARAGNLKIVERLVNFAKTFNVSVLNHFGNNRVDARVVMRKQNCRNDTALHVAVRKGHLDVVKELLGADPGVPCLVNSLGECPLYLAAERGLLEIAHEILQRQNRCGHGGPNGRTALHAAVIHGYLGITRDIVDRMPELLNKVDNFGRTALHYGVSSGDTTTVLLLLKSNPSVAYHLDEDGVSPLHIAAAKGNTTMIQKLVQHCVDCGELLDNRGRNALHFAVEMEQLRTIKYVLNMRELKQMINEGDSDGNTPLHLATINYSHKIVKVLKADKKVDLSAVNNAGLRARDIADSQCPHTWQPDIRKARTYIVLRLAGALPALRGKGIPGLLPMSKEARESRTNRYKTYASNLVMVAALIATVTFAAAFTMPGGFNSDGPDKGIATLISKAALKVFLVFDTIAMCSSITLLVLLITVANVDQVSKRHVTILLWVALLAMLVTFVTGVYVVVAAKFEWVVVVVCIISCFVAYLNFM